MTEERKAMRQRIGDPPISKPQETKQQEPVLELVMVDFMGANSCDGETSIRKSPGVSLKIENGRVLVEKREVVVSYPLEKCALRFLRVRPPAKT